MAWETRKGKGAYYTRSKRVNGRVVREYIGTGQIASAIADLDSILHYKLFRNRHIIKREKADIRLLEHNIKKQDVAVKELLQLALLLNDYHIRCGQLRKKRKSGNKSIRRINKNQIRRLLKTNSEWVRVYRFQSELLKLIDNKIFKIEPQIYQEIDPQEIRSKLGYLQSNQLEKMIINQLTIRWLQLHLLKTMYIKNLSRFNSLKYGDYLEKRISSTKTFFLGNAKTLAEVFRLNLPAIRLGTTGRTIKIGY